ncbi:MAG: dUTP diphosphatase [Candidatus Cloacimonetes bacterium]|nr:dUTP diphosphatase [Actinomycetota bacterium]MBL7085698.1 dUTP diphosphatase [Candidatus Cloacimonadota bacterium]
MTINVINTSDNKLPEYAKYGDSGMDIRSNSELIIKQHETKIVGTGLFLEIPYCYEIQIRPRSGLAFKNGITILNTPGTIDHGYRGEIKILLYNTNKNDFIVTKGMRIAQLVLQKVPKISWNLVDTISNSHRGKTGFGDSGI